MARTLGEVAVELGATLEILRMAPEDYPFATRAGHEMRARQARDTQLELRKEYQGLLQQAAVTVYLVQNEFSDEFVNLVKEDGQGITADASELYRSIAAKVAPSIGSRNEFGTDQYHIVIREALHAAQDLGMEILDVSPPRSFTPASVNTPEALVAHVRKVVREEVGDNLSAEFVAKRLAEAALEADVDAPVPVLVYGIDSIAEAGAIQKAWPSLGRAVELTEQATSDSVVETFRQLRGGPATNPKKQQKKAKE